MPDWMRTLYIYILSGYPDLRADNLEVYTDTKGKHWIQPRSSSLSCVDQYPLVQEFLDGLQDE